MLEAIEAMKRTIRRCKTETDRNKYKKFKKRHKNWKNASKNKGSL